MDKVISTEGDLNRAIDILNHANAKITRKNSLTSRIKELDKNTSKNIFKIIGVAIEKFFLKAKLNSVQRDLNSTGIHSEFEGGIKFRASYATKTLEMLKSSGKGEVSTDEDGYSSDLRNTILASFMITSGLMKTG